MLIDDIGPSAEGLFILKKHILCKMINININKSTLKILSWSHKSHQITKDIYPINSLQWENSKYWKWYINNELVNQLEYIQIECLNCKQKYYSIILSRFRKIILKKMKLPICRTCSNIKNMKKVDINSRNKKRKNNWNNKSELEKKEIGFKISERKLKRKISKEEIEHSIQLYNNGGTIRDISNFLKIKNLSSVQKLLRRNGAILRNFSNARHFYFSKNPNKNPFNKNETKFKIKQTNLKKYGYENPTQNKDIAIKISNSKMKKFYNELIILPKFTNIIQPLFSINEYHGGNNTYKWMCKKCGSIFIDHITSHIPRCLKCNPKNIPSSKYEKNIYNWLKEIGIDSILNTKKIIFPLELDVFVPSHKVAIEFNGLYWHSESKGKNSNYHLNKTLLCKKKGISLIHIFEDEWTNKQEIVKSIIKSKLKIYDRVICDEECEIREIKNDDFFEENHIQGNITHQVSLGLFYKDELISMLAVSKNKSGWEINRFCNKLNVGINSFPKLLKYFKKDYQENIIINVDLRISDDDIYLKNGFHLLYNSQPTFYYTDYKYRYLEDKNNLDKIWNCGYGVFLLS